MSAKLGDWVIITSTVSPAANVVKITHPTQLEDLPGYITYTVLSKELQGLLDREIG